MAKKTKDAATATKKPAKVKGPVDPVKTNNLIRLLNILALLLAIAAFLLQLFAVLSHHWKWQNTKLHSLVSNDYRYSQRNIYEDSQIDQNYGLYSRDVKVYANNDEQFDVFSSTRFPRIDDSEANFHQCLSQSSTLRGVFLTCSKRFVTSPQCHCRRYTYWNFVIFFEIAALVLLGIVVFLVALLTTEFQAILKLAAAGLALLAFIFLLVGLILIVTHLKRETRSFADVYPHIQQQIADTLGIVPDQYRAQQRNLNPLRRGIRRRATEYYRLYSLSDDQIPYNETHFQEYSEQARAWVYKPYTSLAAPAAYSALSQQNTTAVPLYNKYGPVIGYDQVFDNTKACIGWSTILSIVATALSLLLPLILIFSWLTGKKLGPTTTKTVKSVQKEYEPVPTDVPVEVVTGRPIPTDYNPQRPVGDAIVTTRNVTQPAPYEVYVSASEPIIVRDVIIRDEQPTLQITEEYSAPVKLES